VSPFPNPSACETPSLEKSVTSISNLASQHRGGIALLLTLPFSLGLSAQSPFTAPHDLPADRAAGGHAVTVEQCKEWLYTLASPEFEGRKTGQPGFLKAAEYVSAHFRELGLEARGEDGGYYQTVPWSATKVDTEKSHVTFHKGGKEVLRIPASRLSGNVSASLTAEGEVALLVVAPPERPEAPAGRGGRRRFVMPKIPGLAEIDVTDKIVVVYLQPDENGTSAAMTRFAVTRGIAGKGAAGVLFAQQDNVTGSLRGRSGSRRSTNPAASGRGRRPGDTTFGGSDLVGMLASADVHEDVLEGSEFQPAIELSASIELVCEEGQAPAMNVWAVLPGTDPQLKDEYVVIGSHLDHIGMRGGLHPGADDDGSGTTGVMAVAQMFAKNPVKPKRSILFVCFAGEEDGLVGSGFFARNPPIPLSSMVAELQMDMIGRDEEDNRESRGADKQEKAEDNRSSLHLVGTQKLAPSLHKLCLAKNDSAGFDIEYDQEGMFGRSDHANFARKGVPVAFFFTGLHRDYHGVGDTPDKIHYEKLLRVASYVYDIGFELAQQSGRPEIAPELWKKNGGRGAPEKPAAPLIGGGDK